MPNDDNDRWLSPAFPELYRVLARDRFCVSFHGWAHAYRFIRVGGAAGFWLVGHLAEMRLQKLRLLLTALALAFGWRRHG